MTRSGCVSGSIATGHGARSAAPSSRTATWSSSDTTAGDAPAGFWGDDDDEYWLTVPAEEKDRVLLALLEGLYRGRFDAVSRFRDLLETKGIPYRFVNWV
jgi:hypothetical protein